MTAREMLNVRIKTAFLLENFECEVRDIEIDRHATLSDLWNLVEEIFPNLFQVSHRRLKLYTSSGSKVRAISYLEEANFIYLVDEDWLNEVTRLQLFTGA